MSYFAFRISQKTNISILSMRKDKLPTIEEQLETKDISNQTQKP